uniref:Enkurin domain containing 1 n=1 Tax=Cyprinus carpio TaxID=7962 RepID=A0A8C1SE29_CYPCA
MCEGPSAISGPIPPDPTLFPEYYKRPSSGKIETVRLTSARSTPRPRIGANAAHILERGQRGVVGDLLKLEGVALNPSPAKPKPAVRDFGKENVRKLREIQRRFRELEAQREHAKPAPVKALWISPKYQDVSSRVMAQLQMHVRGHTVDFVSHNAHAAGKTNLRRSQSLQNLRDKPPPSAVKGKVPQYLEQRKLQWKKEEDERRRNTPDPSVPAGHTQMSERERQETLRSLKDSRSLVSELLSLPIKADTLSVRSRRAQLDQRLSEVEEAIKIFSRDKVYVKVDS